MNGFPEPLADGFSFEERERYGLPIPARLFRLAEWDLEERVAEEVFDAECEAFDKGVDACVQLVRKVLGDGCAEIIAEHKDELEALEALAWKDV